ncbi:MAG: PD-(D/E)XK nuclease family protein, partial [Synechococcaceae cyanobacterium RM1_1_27]|nr:PD-(D/E)XK nuclease family protein [Synechococcaceae cyanobacterium RM1_1_27]
MPTPLAQLPLQQSVRLSAAALSTFARCARQFRHLYLDQLSLPANTPEQERGRQFHRLVELHSQGQPVVDRLLGVDPQVQHWWQAFESSPHWDPQAEIRSELPLWTSLESWRIVARLDRLVLPDPTSRDPIEIIDWKTERQRPSDADLTHNWQVRLYPLLVRG